MIVRADTALPAALIPSPNIEPRKDGARPSMLILHYTGMTSAQAAIRWLATPVSRVSCHYVIDEAGRITQMVAEEMRAWHAGVSYWAGQTDLNSQSIGAEIQNPGHGPGYADFPEAQMQAVIALSRDIVRRNQIPPTRVLGHSDVAPTRKIDPGEKFPWARLAAAGLGHWVEPASIDPADAGALPGDGAAIADEVLLRLAAYGYGIEPGNHAQQRQVIAAFQRHFRPARVDGCADRSTLLTVERLLAALAMA